MDLSAYHSKTAPATTSQQNVQPALDSPRFRRRRFVGSLILPHRTLFLHQYPLQHLPKPE